MTACWVSIRILGVCWVLAMALSGAHADQSSVLFLNPGKAQESFWGDVDGLMAAAAEDLDLRLEVFHAEREHLRMAKFLAARLKRPPLPDYVVLTNERQVGAKLLQLLHSYSIPVLFILNDITPRQRSELAQDPHWAKYLLPAVVPDNNWIGKRTMSKLLDQGVASAPQVIMISGDKSTPASMARDAGAKEALVQHKPARLLQQVYGQWDELTAYGQMQVLLRRYPDVTHIWTANNHMAFGVLRALIEAGRVPGQDIWLSSINTSPYVLQLRQQGHISVLGGGHFVSGALGLLLINEHRQGHPLPLVTDLSLFTLIEPETPLFSRLLRRQWREIEFKRLKAQSAQWTRLDGWLQ